MKHKTLTDYRNGAGASAKSKKRNTVEHAVSSPYHAEKKKRRESEEIFRL